MRNHPSEMLLTPLELYKRIELLREQLIKAGQVYGLNSEKTIAKSHELDHYISLFQRCPLKENRINYNSDRTNP